MAIVLVVISAVIHAAWNLLGKHNHPRAAFFVLTSLAGALVLTPLVALQWDLVLLMPRSSWLLVAIAGGFQATYYTGLAGAYRSGDLSVAYPVARALPVLLVPVVSALLGNTIALTPIVIAGMATVVVGILVVPLGLRRSAPAAGPAIWARYALLAAVGTTGYTVVDDAALRAFRAAVGGAAGGPPGGAVPGGAVPGGVASAIYVPVVYAFCESVATAVVLAITLVAVYGLRGFGRQIRAVPRRAAAVAGVAIVLAYGIVLIAYGFAPQVSLVVAFRQLSLPIGLLLAVVVLKEAATRQRIIGTVVVLIGLVIVAIG